MSFLPVGLGFPFIKPHKVLHHLCFRSSFSLPPSSSQNMHIFTLGTFLAALGLSFLSGEEKMDSLRSLHALDNAVGWSDCSRKSWELGYLLIFLPFHFYFPAHLQLSLNLPLLFFLLSGVHHRCNPRRAGRAGRGGFESRPPESEE